MKKLILIGFLMCMLACLAGCTKDAPASSGESSTQAGSSVLPSAESAAASSAQEENNTAGTPGVDVDLTALSSTMVYAEVYQMMMEPENYVGKVIKMKGAYYANYYDTTKRYYHFVVVQDATACCAQGLEFFWEGDHVYPDAYPADQAEVEVVGEFQKYEEDGTAYYHIVTDTIEVL